MEVSGVLIFFTIIAAASAEFHQNTYDIMHDRIEILTYNKLAVQNPDLKVVKYNETMKMKAINGSGTFTLSVQRNIKVEITIFRLVGNTYRLFPINATIDGCDLNNKGPIMGLYTTLLQHTNFKGCPAKAGYYYLKFYHIEQDKFPPHIPFGKYKLFMDVHVNDDNVFIGNGNWYGAIVPRSKN